MYSIIRTDLETGEYITMSERFTSRNGADKAASFLTLADRSAGANTEYTTLDPNNLIMARYSNGHCILYVQSDAAYRPI